MAMNRGGMATGMKTASWLLVSIAFAGVSSLFANSISTQIPFYLHRDHFIVVQGSIGDQQNLNFVVDTGATNTMISKKLAKQLGLKGKKKTAVAVGQKVKVEEVVLPDVQIGIACFESVTARVGRLAFVHGLEVDALIGLTLLKRSNIAIDYTRMTLTLGSVPSCDSFIDFYGRLPFVLVRMQVQGQPLALLLDSGAGNDLILFKERVKDRFTWTRTNEKRSVQHLGGKTQLKKVQLYDVEMGRSQWAELTAYVMEDQVDGYGTLDGILGSGALGLDKLQLDFQNNRMSWEP
jgi:predicted aspartyl protease